MTARKSLVKPIAEFSTSTGTYDVVLDAAGTESSLARSAEATRPGGRIISLGVYNTTMPVPGVVSLTKELTYINSIAYGRHHGIREVEDVASMLAKNPEIAQTIITLWVPKIASPHATCEYS